jgi:dTDP-4-amino-4,6-dideoxygalactose transaminase
MRVGRTQPPVGYRMSLTDLVSAAVPRQSSTNAFLDELATTLRVPHAFGLSSGKAALTTVLQALHAVSGRRKVILPAYTCYSVPSAIVKAGFEPVPCDIARGSFDYDYDQLAAKLDSEVLCALSVHLFGIPSNTGALSDMCRPLGIYVVEDAAQAMGVESEGQWLGTRGDAGFFSLGRGKNITSGSGGIIVTRSGEIAQALRAIVQRLPTPKAADDLSTFATLALLSVFVSPSLYWFPAGLPFLRLGETIFYDDFPISRFSSFQARLLRDWPVQLVRLNASRLEAAHFYLRHIESAREYGTNVPYLRFPLLVSNLEARRALLAEGNGRRLGISWMYPTSVGAIPQLAGRLAERSFPEAERVSLSLVTLPTHPLLSKDDMARIADLVNAAMRGAKGVRKSSVL